MGERNCVDAYLANVCLALCSVSGLRSSITAALKVFRICRVPVNKRHDGGKPVYSEPWELRLLITHFPSTLTSVPVRKADNLCVRAQRSALIYSPMINVEVLSSIPLFLYTSWYVSFFAA